MPHQLSVVAHQKYFFEKFENSNHDIIQANSSYLLNSNIPKSSITPISLVSHGNMLDHKFQVYSGTYLLIVGLNLRTANRLASN